MVAAEVDDDVKAYFTKFTREPAPSEHFPLMEVPGYDCQEQLASKEVFYQSELGYDDNDGVQLGKAILAMKPENLRQIYLTKNAIGDAGAASIATGIKELERMDTLHFADNQIGDAGVVALADCIKHLGLTTVVLTRNTFGDEGALAIAKPLADPAFFERLEWLFLNECQIGDKGAVAVMEALMTGGPELNRLALHDNKIGDEGAAGIAAAINKGAGAQTLEFFYLQGNPFTDVGKIKVSDACKGKVRVHLGWPPPLGGLSPEDWDVDG